jgi:hypothetical protein
MTFLKTALVIVMLLALALGALVAFGRWRWDGLTQDLFARLEAARVQHETATFNARELDGLPPVVQRYFRTVLRDGAPIVNAVSVNHSGQFNMGETTDRWTPFNSRQRVVTQRPGFVWDGTMRLLPGLNIRVHDAYLTGEGLLRHPCSARSRSWSCAEVATWRKASSCAFSPKPPGTPPPCCPARAFNGQPSTTARPRPR